MKIKATKLPSGTWRCQVMVEGERISVTGRTKKECEQRAIEVKQSGVEQRRNFTVSEAVNTYIEAHDKGAFSPSTIREYRRWSTTYFQGIQKRNINSLTSLDIQRAINIDAQKYAPKTVKNAWGLLSATLKMFRPEFHAAVKLPQKEKVPVAVPEIAEIQALVKAIEGDDCEIAILLAIQCGLRLSEILGLQWENVDTEAGSIYICNAKVMGDDHSREVDKAPKTYAGYRTLYVSGRLLDLLRDAECATGYVCPYSRTKLRKHFVKATTAAGIQHYRFHDLRHFTASVYLANNVPDKYGMEMMGHSSTYTYKQVYQATLSKENEELKREFNKDMRAVLEGKNSAN